MRQTLLDAWSRRGPLARLLWPLSVLYGVLTGLRRFLYRVGVFKAGQAGVPVVVVGNVIAGGAGKTPVVMALVKHLQARGWQVGVVSRGHGRHSSGCREVHPDDHPGDVGDEPALIRRRCNAPVFVASRRWQAARALLRAYPRTQLIVCDDGLQHYALARTVEIAVIDGQRGLGSGWRLPAGPLREPVSRLQSVDLVVVNGAWRAADSMPGAAATMTLTAAPWQPVRADEVASVPTSGPVHAVAGIGHPPRFFALLAEQGFQPIPHAFPDHHAYTAGDLQFSPPAPVVMTEKDAVKCAGIAPPNSWYVPVQAILPDSFWQALTQRLAPWRTSDAG